MLGRKLTPMQVARVGEGQTLRWRHLTTEQVVILKEHGVLNGCGSKGAWVRVPQWLFRACCDHHDFNYWIGGDAKERKRADVQFWAAMKKDVATLMWLRRPVALIVARTYYWAVRLFGGKAFNWGEPRGWDSLRLALRADITASE